MDYLDQPRIRRAFDAVAPGFDTADFIHSEIRARLLERLDAVDIDPAAVLDLGAGTLGAADNLHRRYPGADLVAVDLSADMLRAGRPFPERTLAVAGDAQRLPFVDGGFDIVFSNLALHWCPDLAAASHEARRMLRYPGVFCFTLFGPDTLAELRSAFAAADTHSHVSPFIDMHDLGDLLVNSGFGEPVMDRETITVTYAEPAGLFRDLRGAGSINATADRNRGLTGRRTWQRVRSALMSHAGADGRFAVTLEVVYGQAWATSAPPPALRTDDGRVRIPVEVIRNR